MPLDPSQPYVPSSNPSTNPFMGVSQGISSGVDWAHQKASVDLAKQSLDQQQQQHDEMKREFNIKTGTQKYDRFNEIVKLPNGELKNSMLKTFKTEWDQAGMPVSEDFLAGAKDVNFQMKWDKLVKAATGTQVEDTDSFNQAMTGIHTFMGDKYSSDALDKVMSSLAMVKAAKTRLNATDDRQQRRMDNQTHQATLKRLSSNTGMLARLNQIQNIDNAFAALTDADISTPQQFQEAQQTIRSNMGIKGTSGVGERESTFLNSLGLKADVFQQFLTANPKDIGKNSPFMLHIKQVAGIERQKAQAQFESKLSALTAGNEDMYDRNPQFKRDLENTVRAYKAQTEPTKSQPSEAAAGGIPNTAELEQKARVIKGAYDAASPSKKALILQKAKSQFPPELLQKMGIQ